MVNIKQKAIVDSQKIKKREFEHTPYRKLKKKIPKKAARKEQRNYKTARNQLMRWH